MTVLVHKKRVQCREGGLNQWLCCCSNSLCIGSYPHTFGGSGPAPCTHGIVVSGDRSHPWLLCPGTLTMQVPVELTRRACV